MLKSEYMESNKERLAPIVRPIKQKAKRKQATTVADAPQQPEAEISKRPKLSSNDWETFLRSLAELAIDQGQRQNLSTFLAKNHVKKTFKSHPISASLLSHTMEYEYEDEDVTLQAVLGVAMRFLDDEIGFQAHRYLKKSIEFYQKCSDLDEATLPGFTGHCKNILDLDVTGSSANVEYVRAKVWERHLGAYFADYDEAQRYSMMLPRHAIGRHWILFRTTGCNAISKPHR